MAHGITETDGLVLHKTRAWHGLGTVVEDAPTPAQALELAGLNWKVGFTNGVGGTTEDVPVHTRDWKLVVREDNNEVLGCVSKNYSAIQNEMLSDFASALAAEDDIVKVESAGSLFGGRRIFYLLKSESFNMADDRDEVVPYILLSNSHDGSLSFSARPTSIRVVCNNTLTWALESGGKNIFRLKHTKNLLANVDQARKALKLYSKGVPVFQNQCRQLNAKPLRGEDTNRYFKQMWQVLNGPVDKRGFTKDEITTREVIRNDWARNKCGLLTYHCDRDRLAPTVWTGFNAITEDEQESYSTSPDRNLSSKLFGAGEDKTNKLWNATLKIADQFATA
jgi:phage/plasmid-like protein (TIGR03299 family)